MQRRLGGNMPPSEPPQGRAQETGASSTPATAADLNSMHTLARDRKLRTPPKLARLRKLLRPKLLRTPDEADHWGREDAEKIAMINERLQAVLQKAGAENPEFRVSRDEYEELREYLLDDLLGYGAIQPLIADDSCSEVMVNGPDMVFAEIKGRIIETAHVFDDDDHAYHTALRIARPLGRSLDRSNPMVDARLPDGSRVHLVIVPSALDGTTMSIRKFPKKRMTMDDLVANGSLTAETAEFLNACVKSKLSMVVSGGTGSGKTTLLNILSGYIPEEERVITIEDAAELQLQQRHVVRLETSPAVPNTDGRIGRLEIRDLVKGSLRMRPNRIIVGECRGGEAIDMLQAMNTGHEGSMTTVHSNSPRDAVARLETLGLMAGMDLPVAVIRRQIASAVDLIVQIARMKDGPRKIIQITELQGMEGETVTLQDIFVYRLPGQTGSTPASVSGGKLEPTGFRPKFTERLEENGFRLSARIFGSGQGGNSRFSG